MEIDERGRIVNRWDKVNRSNSSGSYSNNWFEYDRDENFFKTVLLFPFRLIFNIFYYIIKSICAIFRGIFKLIKTTLSIIFFLITAVLKTFIGIPIVIFLIVFSLTILLPIKVTVYIISFGNKNLWEDRLFEKSNNTMEWVKDGWDYDYW